MRGRATSEILTIYGLERFVDRLTRTEFRDDFVLKGGILLAAYQLRRPTRDIDMQALDFPLDEAHLRAMISAAAAVESLLRQREYARRRGRPRGLLRAGVGADPAGVAGREDPRPTRRTGAADCHGAFWPDPRS